MLDTGPQTTMIRSLLLLLLLVGGGGRSVSDRRTLSIEHLNARRPIPAELRPACAEQRHGECKVGGTNPVEEYTGNMGVRRQQRTAQKLGMLGSMDQMRRPPFLSAFVL